MWMKNILILLLSCSLAHSQTKEQLTEYIPAGKQMAYEAYVASGGKLVSRFGKPEYVYEKGLVKGLTEAVAVQKFHAMWANVGDDVKLKYAKQALESGRDPDVNRYLRQLAGEEADDDAETDAQNQRLIEKSRRESEQREIERRLRDLESGQ